MTLYSLVDMFWVAKLGYRALAATTIIWPYFALAFAIGIGSGVGANALASRRFGERNIEATNQVAGQIFSLSAVFGVIFLITAVFFAEPILNISGATPDIMDFATQYLVVLGWSIPFFLFRLMTSNVLRASGEAVKPMIFSILGTVINAVLDPFLIFGWGPFPEMGIGGAALATVIASVFSAGLSFYYLVAHKTVYRIKPHHLKPNLPVLRDIYRVGFPAMIMTITESIVSALFNRVLRGFGSVALAAVGITMRIADLAWMPIFGASQGLLPIVGFCFGARLWERLWRAVRLVSVALVAIMGVATVVLEIFTPQTIGIFSDDPELLAMAVPAMRIFLSTIVLVGPEVVIITAFEGLSKGKEAMILSLVRQLIFFVPALYLLPRIWGITGVWLSLPVSDALAFVVTVLWILREYKMQQRSGMWDAGPAAGVEGVA
jgi:putative MATE family efflux protein